MKLLALILVLLNIGVWYLAEQEKALSVHSQGPLPRVSSIKPAPADNDADRCLKIGWFDDKVKAGQVGAALDRPYHLETVDRSLPPLNWVLVPPRPEAKAYALLEKLHSDDVESWLVREGEYRNAISLGLFESESAAKAFAMEKKQENLGVVLAKFPRHRIGYALVFKVGPEPNYSRVQAVEAEFSKKFEINELVACKGIATLKKTP